ncbi:hypothetical protein AOLI_G00092070 [Acnodon oligacanthus]
MKAPRAAAGLVRAAGSLWRSWSAGRGRRNSGGSWTRTAQGLGREGRDREEGRVEDASGGREAGGWTPELTCCLRLSLPPTFFCPFPNQEIIAELPLASLPSEGGFMSASSAFGRWFCVFWL